MNKLIEFCGHGGGDRNCGVGGWCMGQSSFWGVVCIACQGLLGGGARHTDRPDQAKSAMMQQWECEMRNEAATVLAMMGEEGTRYSFSRACRTSRQAGKQAIGLNGQIPEECQW